MRAPVITSSAWSSSCAAKMNMCQWSSFRLTEDEQHARSMSSTSTQGGVEKHLDHPPIHLASPGVDCRKFPTVDCRPTVGRKLKPKSTVSRGALRKVDS
eukprot:1196304-Prorocentrum_minimum.AAC.11